MSTRSDSSKMGRRWASAGPVALSLHGVGLADVEDGCCPGPAVAALGLVRLGGFIGGWFARIALSVAFDERANLHAMLAAAHLAAQRAPRMVSEDIFARLDVLFGN